MSVDKNKITKKTMAPEPSPKLIKRFKEINRPITSAQYPPFIKTKPIQIEGMAKGFKITVILWRELVEPQYNKSSRYKMELQELMIKAPNGFHKRDKYIAHYRHLKNEAINSGSIQKDYTFWKHEYKKDAFSNHLLKKKGELVSAEEIYEVINEMVIVFNKLQLITKIPTDRQMRSTAQKVHKQLDAKLKVLGNPAY